MCAQEIYICTFLKHRYSHSFLLLFISRSSWADFNKITTTIDLTTRTDIMKKTVKLMISISNKSNPITTNTNLILNEIMRCLHQLRMLIS